MTLLHILLTPFLYAPLLLLVIYTGFIQHQRGGWYVACKWVFGVVGYPLDVALNYTVFRLYFQDKPLSGEYTLSIRIGRRLKLDPGWRGDIARVVRHVLNWIAPLGNHIP